MTDTTHDTDVVVVGSGMAGLVSTVRALEQGAEVTLLEKGHRLGGTTRVTGGYIAVDDASDPNIDPFEPIERSLDWLENLGVVVNYLDRWEHGEIQTSSIRIDPPQFVDRMAEHIDSLGGTVKLQTSFERVTPGDSGAVDGVLAWNVEEGSMEIASPSVILAAGGRSGNQGMVEEYYPQTDVWLGRDPWSTGDGFEAARAVGGKTTGDLATPVGVSRPAPPAEIAFEDMRCGQIYDTSSIALTQAGRRFTDESDSVAQSDGFINEYLKRVEGPVWLIIDQELYENTDRYQSAVSDRLELARELGGEVIEADTIEELCSSLCDAGVDGDQALETITEFNRAVSGTYDESLTPPRTDYRVPLDTPPFYATKVIPAILYFVGGLDVDEHSQVLSRARSTSSLPYAPETEGEFRREAIPGLYAAGVEVGKQTEDGYYRGGLSLGLGTGRIAGKHAAQYAKSSPIEQAHR